MTIMKSFLVAFACLAAVSDARTTVAVLELGKGGTVRRTTSTNAQTTVAGVASFWSSMHGGIHHTSLQHAGHTVVPDLFNKADGGVVIGLTNVDLSAMPTLTNLIEEESPSNRVVAHLELDGAMSRPLLQKVGIAEEATEKSLQSAATPKSQHKGLSAMRVQVNEENASTVDTNVASLVQSLHKEALEQDRTIVLHLVVEEEEGSSRRRLAASSRRRLEEEGGEGDQQDGEQDGGDQNQEDGGDNQDGGDAAEGNGKNGYYGYGYYNSYGEWLTPYKTMFQIQYFNVVLWTALGLVAVLLFAIYLTIFMPLEADTLLFGESAKMMSD